MKKNMWLAKEQEAIYHYTYAGAASGVAAAAVAALVAFSTALATTAGDAPLFFEARAAAAEAVDAALIAAFEAP